MAFSSTQPTLVSSQESTEASQASEGLNDIENCLEDVRPSPKATFFQSKDSAELQQTIEKIVCARLIDLDNRLDEVRPSPNPELFLSQGSTELEQAIEKIVCTRLIDLENRLEHLHALHMDKSEARHAELVALLCENSLGSRASTSKQQGESTHGWKQSMEDGNGVCANMAPTVHAVLSEAGDSTKQDARLELNMFQSVRKLQAALEDFNGTIPARKSGRRVSRISSRSSTNCGRDYKPSSTGPGFQLRCRQDIKTIHGRKSKEVLYGRQINFVDEIYARGNKRGRSLNIWRFFEDPNSSRMAKFYSNFLPIYIIMSVLCSLLELVSPAPFLRMELSTQDKLQISFEALFMLELSLRFLTCPHPLLFWTHFYNILEPLSCVALILRMIVRGSFGFENGLIRALSCIVPVVRSMKLIKHFEHFQLLFSAFRSAAEALPVLLFTLVLITLTFSGVIFCIEQDMAPTYMDALFFTIVTMSTVGFGNQVPGTTLGMGVVGVLIVISGLYLAIPIGIVGNAFSIVWGERGRLMILHRLRRFIVRAGFTFSDLQALFQMFDEDSDGTLGVDEFATMMEIMQIGMERDWVLDVFETFDDDGDASIDYEEFLKCLFPRAHKFAIRASYPIALNSITSTEQDEGITDVDLQEEEYPWRRTSLRSNCSQFSVLSQELDNNLGPLKN